uniref:Uncharacterized protein n=1 Tax=Rhizophora mucronata TaxID=61149 RepID=A0A2P2NJX7_RHIMU
MQISVFYNHNLLNVTCTSGISD